MKCPVAWIGVAVLLGLAPSLAHGQSQSAAGETRSGRLAGERDEKATETAPPERTTVERGLYWYDNQHLLEKISTGWNGFRLASGGFPAGAGVKLGVGYSHMFGPAADVQASNRITVGMLTAGSTRGYNRVAGSLNVERIAGAPINARIHAQYHEFPQEDFFGFGADSHSDDRTNYLQKGTEGGAEVTWNPVKRVIFSGGASLMRPTMGSGTDSRYPSIEEVFDPSTLPGFSEETDLLRSDASVAFDWRDNPLYPHAGGRYSVQYSNFDDRDLARFGFQRVAVELQQYVPLPKRYRTLALRAAAVMADPHAGQEVPFYLQPTLGGSQELRGFREFRFRDRNSLLFTAEYRWEASWMLDGALFADAGKVAFDRRDLTLKDLDVSYGVGFRLHSNRAFVSRLDLAFSREGFIPLLRFEHVF